MTVAARALDFIAAGYPCEVTRTEVLGALGVTDGRLDAILADTEHLGVPVRERRARREPGGPFVVAYSLAVCNCRACRAERGEA